MSEQDTGNELVTVMIDGAKISVPKGTLVIEAARQGGVMIPHFCYHSKLAPDANCRMCLVEIEKIPRLQTSCSTRVAEGMVVRSAVPRVEEARKSVLEFILANHPLDCPVCDQGGRCDLQDFSHHYTATTSRFKELKRVFNKEYFSPLIETQMNRCVQCLRCVRYCDQVMDVKALAPVGRGTMTEIKSFGTHELDCEFCGGCIQICPVGAITSRVSMYDFRPWMLKRAETICTYCGDGCRITLQTKNNDVIEVNSTLGTGRNNGDLCAKGYFGYQVTVHPDRLKTPLIRRDGELREASWKEALETVAARFTDLTSLNGADAIGGLISSRCTNEELYLFQKLMRLVVGTNKIDSSVRYGHINGVQALKRVAGVHRWMVTFEDILSADALLLVGTNITETNPITGLKVKEAVKRRGAQLITLEALKPAVGVISNISLLSSHHLPLHPDQFDVGIIGLLKAVVEEGHVDPELTKQAPRYCQAISHQIEQIPWPVIESQLGLNASSFKDAARTFCEATRGIILVGQGVLRVRGGYGMTMNLLDLLVLTGKLGQPGCGVAPLAEENNDQGAIEMGAVPEFLPGAVSMTDSQAREKISSAWGQELLCHSGASLMTMIEEARNGRLKAMFIVGENPVASLPHAAQVEEAFSHLDFLVCQELFLTETAKLAHVVLPACSYAEKDGTFTNTEGHMQAVRKAIDPLGESQPDWDIFSALSVAMCMPLEYESVRDITKEIRSLFPETRTLGPSPMPPKADPDTIQRYVQNGFESDVSERYRLPEPISNDSDCLTLAVTQSLFHSGKFSTKAKGLLRLQDKGCLNMNPCDAKRLGLQSGDEVRVSNALGTIQTTVKLLDRVPDGTLFFPEHFDGDVRRLLHVVVDSHTQVPSFKVAQVHVEKVAP